jgi:hypothetical protein
MAGKRINNKAPLTGAEKQKRYRIKKNEEEAVAREAALAGMEKEMRRLLIEHINELNRSELFCFYDRAASPEKYMNRYVTLEELSELIGIPLYELKKLEKQGVISPAKNVA